MDKRRKAGFTADGLPCELILYYAPGAPKGELPVRIAGRYQVQDGAGRFEIVREGDHYRNSNTGAINGQPVKLLPWVIAEGIW